MKRAFLLTTLLLMCAMYMRADVYEFSGTDLTKLLDAGKTLSAEGLPVLANGGALLSDDGSTESISYSLNQNTGNLEIKPSGTYIGEVCLDLPCSIEGIASVEIFTDHEAGEPEDWSGLSHVGLTSFNSNGEQKEDGMRLEILPTEEGGKHFLIKKEEVVGLVDCRNAKHGLRLSFAKLTNISTLIVKSIVITTAERDFSFSVENITLTAYEDGINIPEFVGSEIPSNNITFVCTDEVVAEVFYDEELPDDRYIYPYEPGTATIVAEVPATEYLPAGRASLTITVTEEGGGNESAKGTVEDVTVTEPNTLRYMLADLESTAVSELIIHGKLGSEDLALLREQKGRLQNLQTLDLSDIELVADEGVYSTVLTDHNDLNIVTYNIYHLSEREDSVYNYIYYDGIEGIKTWDIYTMNLGGAFAGMTSLKKLILPSYMTSIGSYIAHSASGLQETVLPEHVTDIPRSAFQDCKKLRKINIENVKSIGSYAFSKTSFTDIDLSQVRNIGESAFSNTPLQDVKLSNIETMGESAFAGSFVRTVDLGGIENIPNMAFHECKLLKDVVWGNKLNTIGDYAFTYTALTDLYLPEGLTRIGTFSFRETKVSTIHFPSTLCRTASNSFLNTPWDKEQTASTADGFVYAGKILLHGAKQWNTPTNYHLEIPEGIICVSDNFYMNNEENITKLTLPSTIKCVGDEAFSSSNLEEFNLPEGLEIIGEKTFSGLKKIDTLTIPSSVKEIGNYAFANSESLVRVTYNATSSGGGEHIFSECSALEKVMVGANVTEIPASAFYKCKYLLKVDFQTTTAEANSTSLDEEKFTFAPNCFYGCKLLASIDFPENTDSIGKSAFEFSGLKEALLPWNVRSVGDEAFSSCNSLKEVCLPASLEYLEDRTFLYSPITAIYAYGKQPIHVRMSVDYNNFLRQYFTTLAETANVYVLPGYQEIWLADEVWSKFNIFAMDDEHVALGVSTIQNNGTDKTIMYDLTGRRINRPMRGSIYIKDGKKYFSK